MKNITNKKKIFFTLLIILLNSCLTTNKTARDKKIICELVDAIVKADTSYIYNVVDTAFHNHLYGNNSLIYTVNSIHKELVSPQSIINLDSLAFINEILGTRVYQLPIYYKGKRGDSLLFSFIFDIYNDNRTNVVQTFKIKKKYVIKTIHL